MWGDNWIFVNKVMSKMIDFDTPTILSVGIIVNYSMSSNKFY